MEVFIGQAFGAFWLPCHERTDYSDPEWRTAYETPQCAGAAIFRSNCHPAERPDFLLLLPSDVENVFASDAEFMAHHTNITLAAADGRLKVRTPMQHWINEMARANAKVIV